MKKESYLMYFVAHLLLVNFSEAEAKKENNQCRDGEMQTLGCIKETCKSGVWRASLDETVCCYEGEGYGPGEQITSVDDGCMTTKVFCVADELMAKLNVEVENNCLKIDIIEEKVQKIEENVDDVEAKVGSLDHNVDALGEKVNNIGRNLDELIMLFEKTGHHSDLKDLTTTTTMKTTTSTTSTT